MDSYTITPAKRLEGRIVLPASKSISGRALILNALSGGGSLPENLSDSDDTQTLLRALQGLSGLLSNEEESGDVSLPLREGRGGSFIDIGPAGTAMRFLTAYLSVTPGEHFLTGSERMKHRPIAPLVDALRELGADIAYEGEEGFPPLRITGRSDLKGGSLTIDASISSQYISALLMIAPTLREGLRLTLARKIASRPYLDMTLSMMRDFGAEADWTAKDVIEVKPGSYRPTPYRIESDWSAASYWYEAVALSKDMKSTVDLVGLRHDSIQGDSKVRKMFAELGVGTHYLAEPDGTETVRLTKNDNVTCHFTADFTDTPDLAQTLAAACAMLDVPFHLCGLGSLRIKETDRIDALDKELSKLADVEVVGDELRTPSDSSPCKGDAGRGPFTFDTYDDHRMAMALAPVCLRTEGEIQINNPQVVSKSYPHFWDDLEKAGFRVWR